MRSSKRIIQNIAQEVVAQYDFDVDFMTLNMLKVDYIFIFLDFVTI